MPDTSHQNSEDSRLPVHPVWLVSAFFALLIAARVLLASGFHTPFILADEAVYDNIARNILTGKFYSTLSYCQTYPPGYSVILALAHAVTADQGLAYHLMLGINAVLTSSIIFPAYFMLRKYCREGTAIWGSLAIAVLPAIGTYPFVIMSENLFTPLFMYSLWFLAEAYESGGRHWQALASLSVVYLYFTRSIGLAMAVGLVASFGYFLWANRRRSVAILREYAVMALLFILPLAAYLAYGRFLMPVATGSIVSTYDDSLYIGALLGAAGSLSSLLTFLSLSLHELEYLVLSAYFIVFLGLAMVAVYPRHNDGKAYPAALYLAVSALATIVIAVAHMYIARDSPYYALFGRYLDPVVPALFLCGILGLDRARMDLKSVAAIFAAFVATVAVFLLTFPVTYYKFGSMFAVFYMQDIGKSMPAYLFIALLFFTTATAYVVASWKKRMGTLMMVLILLSLYLTSYTFCTESMSSANFEKNNQIARYLQGMPDNTTVLMDESDFSTDAGKTLWFSIEFWMRGDMVQGTVGNESASLPGNADYVITSKQLPDKQLAVTDNGYRLYAVK